jgi:hypothetical protein
MLTFAPYLQQLGGRAERVVEERKLKLRATIFDAKSASIRSNYDIAAELDSPAWSDLEKEFETSSSIRSKSKLSMKSASTQVIIGGEQSIFGRHNLC